MSFTKKYSYVSECVAFEYLGSWVSCVCCFVSHLGRTNFLDSWSIINHFQIYIFQIILFYLRIFIILDTRVTTVELKLLSLWLSVFPGPSDCDYVCEKLFCWNMALSLNFLDIIYYVVPTFISLTLCLPPPPRKFLVFRLKIIQKVCFEL